MPTGTSDMHSELFSRRKVASGAGVYIEDCFPPSSALPPTWDSTLLSMRLWKVHIVQCFTQRLGQKLPQACFFDGRPFLLQSTLTSFTWSAKLLILCTPVKLKHVLSLSLALGKVMSHVLEEDDKRDQLLVDNDLRVTWKLTCGAIAGATAQSGKQSHYNKDSISILIWIALAMVPDLSCFLCINCIVWVWCREGNYTPHQWNMYALSPRASFFPEDW